MIAHLCRPATLRTGKNHCMIIIMQSFHGTRTAGSRRRSDAERVVITGLGAVTPIGLTAPAFWESLVAGRSGAAPITAFDASEWETTFACEVKGLDPLAHIERKLANRLDPYAQYAVIAADEAIADAGLDPASLTMSQRERIGVIVGSGIGGIQTLEKQSAVLLSHGRRRVSPFLIPMMIPDMAAGVISMRHGFHGPNHAVVSACATGNHNLEDALHAIRRGEADVIVCGGSEAPICPLGVAGFAASRALSTRNDSPATASRPFDAERDGFVMGEGAAVLIVESLEHARRRGARIYAEVLGTGSSADAHHMTAPHPDGLGARLAMRRALDAARVALDEVDTINMHGTSTTLGDVAESRAIRELFGEHACRVTATSTKSMTGHMLGAAGSAEAIASILAIVHGIVPPTINHTHADPACDLAYAFNAPVRRSVRVAMSNAFGFGGHNSSVVFGAVEESAA
jgi:3-oxoacyl-[acyl-carrier-protein] synthase II